MASAVVLPPASTAIYRTATTTSASSSSSSLSTGSASDAGAATATANQSTSGSNGNYNNHAAYPTTSPSSNMAATMPTVGLELNRLSIQSAVSTQTSTTTSAASSSWQTAPLPTGSSAVSIHSSHLSPASTPTSPNSNAFNARQPYYTNTTANFTANANVSATVTTMPGATPASAWRQQQKLHAPPGEIQVIRLDGRDGDFGAPILDVHRTKRTLVDVRPSSPATPKKLGNGASGPPPPSPPASIEGDGEADDREQEAEEGAQEALVWTDEPAPFLPYEPPSPSSSHHQVHLHPLSHLQSLPEPLYSKQPQQQQYYQTPPSPSPSPARPRPPSVSSVTSEPPLQRLHRASTDTKASLRTVIPPPSLRTASQQQQQPTPPTPTASTASAHVRSTMPGQTAAPPEGYLQPHPQAQLHGASASAPLILNPLQQTASLASTVSAASASSSRLAAPPHATPAQQQQQYPHPRPTRRNTTGSAPKQQGHAATPSAAGAISLEDGLETDIRMHAENIRRERMSKRAKALQGAEGEKRDERGYGGQKEDEAPLVGNLIGEGHVNYVLMYNMLTGIRIGVSRCQAKIKRPLTPEDFKAKHKYSFDIVGNELTPSAKYDFKFKDYAPWVFRSLREDYFHLDPADYLLSLTSKYILSELGSPGKSGSFFYFSRDYRFIIKTIRHSEHAFLLSILERYYEHVKENPHTLLSRFYGLHRVKLPRGRKIHFVIMNNIFPPHRDIHETYDLKGSTVGREYPEGNGEESEKGEQMNEKSVSSAGKEKEKEGKRKKKGAVLKDLNWIKKKRQLELGPEKRTLLTEQLRRDSEFLKKINVMDYSLLVGIHNLKRGNRDNVRRNTLKMFSPNLPVTHRKKAVGHVSQGGAASAEAIAMRRAIHRTSDPRRLDIIQLPEPPDEGQDSEDSPGQPPGPQISSATQDDALGVSTALSPRLPSSWSSPQVVSSSRRHYYHHHHGAQQRDYQQEMQDLFSDREHFLFYQDEGGLRATGEENEGQDKIYYLGVIDILTPYGCVKKMEHFWKGLSADRHKISPVPPAEYADRFMRFMRAIMRGGEGGEKFKDE